MEFNIKQEHILGPGLSNLQSSTTNEPRECMSISAVAIKEESPDAEPLCTPVDGKQQILAEEAANVLEIVLEMTCQTEEKPSATTKLDPVPDTGTLKVEDGFVAPILHGLLTSNQLPSTAGMDVSPSRTVNNVTNFKGYVPATSSHACCIVPDLPVLSSVPKTETEYSACGEVLQEHSKEYPIVKIASLVPRIRNDELPLHRIRTYSRARSYSREFKTMVVKRALEKGCHVAGRELGVRVQTVQDWIKPKLLNPSILLSPVTNGVVRPNWQLEQDDRGDPDLNNSMLNAISSEPRECQTMSTLKEVPEVRLSGESSQPRILGTESSGGGVSEYLPITERPKTQGPVRPVPRRPGRPRKQEGQRKKLNVMPKKSKIVSGDIWDLARLEQDGYLEMSKACTVGLKLNQECFEIRVNGFPRWMVFEQLDKMRQDVLQIRSGLTLGQYCTLCPYHNLFYLSGHYENQQKECCDPLFKHPHNKITKGLQNVTYQKMLSILKDYSLLVACGKKLCATCSDFLKTEENNCQSEAADQERNSDQRKETNDHNCTIGLGLKRVCLKIPTNEGQKPVKIGSLRTLEKQHLKDRTGLMLHKNSSICEFHRQTFLVRYSDFQIKCCNPLLLHKGCSVTKTLKVISYKKMKMIWKRLGIKVFCGQKVCQSCMTALSKSLDQQPSDDNTKDAAAEIQESSKDSKSQEENSPGTSEAETSDGEMVAIGACTVGRELGEKCYKVPAQKGTFKTLAFHLLTKKKQEILEIRTGLTLDLGSNVCGYHQYHFLTSYYEKQEVQCCDPLQKHRLPRITEDLVTVTYNRMQIILRDYGLLVPCGKKLCVTCDYALKLKKETQAGMEMEEGNFEVVLEPCSVGTALGEECRTMHARKINDRIPIAEFSRMEQELAEIRTGLLVNEDSTICIFHKEYYLSYYSSRQKKCCNPFGKHKRPVSTGLMLVTYNRMKIFQDLGLKVICGQKICSACLRRLKLKKVEQQANRDMENHQEN